MQGEEVIVYTELHELKWELARMCLEPNWETEAASCFGERCRVNVNSNNINLV